MRVWGAWWLLAVSCSLEVGCSLEVEGSAREDETEEGEHAVSAAPDAAPLSPSPDASDAGETSEAEDAASDAVEASAPDAASEGPAQHAAAQESDAGPGSAAGYQPATGHTGSRCQSDQECTALGSGAFCAKSAPLGSPSGYCTRSCGESSLGNPCGSGAVCAQINGEKTCQRACDQETQCRVEDGYYCSHVIAVGLCWHR